ncbi:MAG: EamA family transporter [Rhodothermaceae bacterium]|mgnify:CR=1 FL=1|nr:EamA family transporter [Rhodothermaceae bacterium]MBC11654.1 EamA family transporter [Rhodothermaceae bacterium]
MTNDKTPPLAAVLAAFAALYVIWGSTYLGIRFAIETMPPFTMAGVRFVAAGAILYAWSRARGAVPATRPQWRTAVVVGACLLLGGNGGVTWAEQFVPSGVAALIVASTPMWMVLLDAVRLRAWPRPAVIAGLALGLVGIWLLVGPSDLGSDPVDPVGALAVGAAAFFWAVGSIYQRGAPKAEATLLNVGMQMLAGGALLLLAGVVLGERLVLADVSAKSAGALAYLVFFGAIVGYSAYVWLLKVSTPAKASTYAYVNPIVAVLLGWALADEPLGPRVLSASLAVVAAVALITTARAARTPVVAVPQSE